MVNSHALTNIDKYSYTLNTGFCFISDRRVCACPQEALQQCPGTLFWWMATFIGLLMLNEPCCSCFNWMLFMWLQVRTPTPCGAPMSHRPCLRLAGPLPSLVCKAAHWWLMNKGLLASQFSLWVLKGVRTNSSVQKKQEEGNGSVWALSPPSCQILCRVVFFASFYQENSIYLRT